MEDQKPISRIKQGDINGLETLVKRYQVRAVHAAYMIVFDHGLAKDVVQTAFVKTAERIHQFDEERPFAPWFFRIVVNDALKIAKKQKRDVSLEKQLDEPSLLLSAHLVDPHPQPEQWLEQKEVRENILAAIQSLPSKQRAVFVMQCFLDMSEKEMSTEMERPLSTLRQNGIHSLERC